jgi:hypothetical protein
MKQLTFIDYFKTHEREMATRSNLQNQATGSIRSLNTTDLNSSIRNLKSHRIHGGELIIGKRKTQRPVVPKKWMHVTLKSSFAKGNLSMLHVRHRMKIQKMIHRYARKYLIKVGDGVNMGNHFHLKIKSPNRECFQNFLRAITGNIARLVTGAQKGKPFGKKFWDSLAFSRVLTSSYEVFLLNTYLTANRKERTHGYQARKKFLNDFNLWMKQHTLNSVNLRTPLE